MATRWLAQAILRITPPEVGIRRLGPLHLVHDWTGRRYIGIPWLLTVGFGPVAMIERVWIGPWRVYADHAAWAEGVRRRAAGQVSE